jgi:hypothetical protein
MPTYFRPARVDITEGGGGLVLIAAGVAAAAAVVAFIAAHIVLLAVCAAVFVAVMGGVAAWMRWAASPARLRRHLYPKGTGTAIPARPAQGLLVPRATRRQLARPWRVVSVEKIPASPRVIEPARVIPPESR